MYEPIATIDVEAWPHDAIAHQSVEVAGLPFRPDYLRDQLPLAWAFGSVLIPGQYANLNGSTVNIGTGVNLLQISDNHARSFEVDWGNEQRMLWSDEFGNLFTSLNTKGNAVFDPELFKHPDSPIGVSIRGAQDGYSLLRIISASKKLREAGVDTEAVIRILEPKTFWLDGEMRTADDFKAVMVHTAWEQDLASLRSNLHADVDETYSVEELADISEALEGTGLFVTVRAMKINDRIEDLSRGIYEDPRSSTPALRVLERTFRIANLCGRYEDEQGLPEFTIKDPVSVEAYFGEYLPRKVGVNLARMHNAGLSHGGLHIGNISMLGGIYDLDSVGGPGLDLDDESEPEATVIVNLDELIGISGGLRWRGDIFSGLEAMELVNCQPEELFQRFQTTVVSEYLRERNALDPSFTTLPLINEISFRFGKDLGKWFEDFHKQQLQHLYGREKLPLEEKMLAQDVDAAIDRTVGAFVGNALHGEVDNTWIASVFKSSFPYEIERLHVSEFADMVCLELAKTAEDVLPDEPAPAVEEAWRSALARVKAQIIPMVRENHLEPIVAEAWDRKIDELVNAGPADKLESTALIKAMGLDYWQPHRFMTPTGITAVYSMQSLVNVLLGLKTQHSNIRVPTFSRMMSGILLPPFFAIEHHPSHLITDGLVEDIRQSGQYHLPIGGSLLYARARQSGQIARGSFRFVILESPVPGFEHPFLLVTNLPEAQMRRYIQYSGGSNGVAIDYIEADQLV